MNQFKCINCDGWVRVKRGIGVKTQNHCPFCLFSKHVDNKVGDRKSKCFGEMEPIALTFKKTEGKTGELMLVHLCRRCQKVSINRIAVDDKEDLLMSVFENSLSLSPEIKERLQKEEIQILSETEKPELLTQLFGKTG